MPYKVNPMTGDLTYYEEAAAAPDTITSSVPTGKYLVTNMYVDPVTLRLVVEYDNTPVISGG